MLINLSDGTKITNNNLGCLGLGGLTKAGTPSILHFETILMRYQGDLKFIS